MIKDSYRSAAAVLCQPVHFYRLILAGCVSCVSFPGLPVRAVLCVPFHFCPCVSVVRFSPFRLGNFYSCRGLLTVSSLILPLRYSGPCRFARAVLFGPFLPCYFRRFGGAKPGCGAYKKTERPVSERSEYRKKQVTELLVTPHCRIGFS